MSDKAPNLAVFIDLENLAIGVRDAKLQRFDIDLVMRRLIEKGNIIVRKAYADWSHFEEYKRPLHEAGVELIDMPGSKLTGKNSADIKMVVDALEMAFTRGHIDVFALCTGDSDFSPLVSKLRENDKRTIGIGVKNSTSRILKDSCDEFIYYDDLAKAKAKPKRARTSTVSKLPKKTQEAFDLLMDAARALQREDRNLHASLVKETMKRIQPQFSEEYHGYNSFGKLLEDAQKHKLIRLNTDSKSRTLIIEEVLDDG